MLPLGDLSPRITALGGRCCSVRQGWVGEGQKAAARTLRLLTGLLKLAGQCQVQATFLLPLSIAGHGLGTLSKAWGAS